MILLFAGVEEDPTERIPMALVHRSFWRATRQAAVCHETPIVKLFRWVVPINVSYFQIYWNPFEFILVQLYWFVLASKAKDLFDHTKG